MTREEVRALAARVGVSDIFSWKSPTARQRGFVPGALTDEALVDAMAGEPRLIRRPLTVTEGEVIIGADLKRLAALASG